jgi:hypothetical protein
MSDLMVCIGGGGQHVALAVSRMVRLGLWNPAPEMFVIDAEAEAPLNNRLREFRERAPNGTAEASDKDRLPHPVPSATRIHPPFDRGRLKGPFPELFLDSKSKPLEQTLFNLFFDRQTADVDVSQGMYARPSVGATVFADRGTDHLQKDLVAAMSRCENVLVASSFVGGTGAGISHQLIRQLRNHVGSDSANSKKRLYGAFLLRWFMIPGAKKDAANDNTVTNSMMHGLDFLYRETRKSLDRSVIVGAYDGMELPEAHPKQDETVSPFPLYAAFGLTRMRSTIFNEPNAIYTLPVPEGGPRWLLRERWVTGAKTDWSIGERWRIVLAFMELVGLMESRRVDFDGMNGPGLGTGLLSGENWGKMLKTVAAKTSTDPRALARQVFDRLLARTQQLRFVTDWLSQNALFGTAELSDFGEAGLKRLSNELAQQRVSAPMAFERFAKSYAHVQTELIAWSKAGGNTESGETPADFVARWIETAMTRDLQS